MTEPRSIEETERDRPDLDTFLRRQAEISAESFGADDPDVARFVEIRELLAERESRIESLVGEREELREALTEISNTDTGERCRKLARSVLSSRETTDRWDNSDERTGRNTDDLTDWPDASRETTDSPAEGRQNSGIPGDEYRCPTCGSDDPAKRRPVIDVNPHSVHNDSHICTDTFHSTDRGKEDS